MRVLYTEQQFANNVFKVTGKTIENGDYGFILGATSPFMESKGVQSASLYHNWEIWKKNSDGSYSTVKINKPVKDLLKVVIDFLTDDVEFYKKSLNRYYDV